MTARRVRRLGSTAADQRVDVHLLDLQAQFQQAPGLTLCGGPVGEIGERIAMPQGQRMLKQERDPVGLTDREELPSPRRLGLELPSVDGVGGHRQGVAVGGGLDGRGTEGFAEPHDARLQVLGRRHRGMVTPQCVHQLLGADRLALPCGEGLEYGALARPQTSRAVHSEGPENGNAHQTTVLPSPHGVNDTNTGCIPRRSRTGTGLAENRGSTANRPPIQGVLMNRYSLASESDRWWVPTTIAGTIGAAAVTAILVAPVIGAPATPAQTPTGDTGSVTLIKRPCYLTRPGWNTPAGWEQPVCTTEIPRGGNGPELGGHPVPTDYLP